MMADQCVFIRGFQVKRVLFGIKIIYAGSGRDDKNSQRSLYRRRTAQRNNGLHNASSILGDNSHIGGSSSSLGTIRSPTNHEYPSSTALQSNGSIYDASFMTSPSYDTLIQVPNDIAEVCLPGHDRSL
jgi:hypothetical protein